MQLSHHGIKGQQWHVRHGPPYPIDSNKGDITIKKGSSFKRLSIHQENTSKGHAYVTSVRKRCLLKRSRIFGRKKGLI